MEHTQISPAERVSGPILLPSALPPMPAVSRILSRYKRDQVEAFVEIAVAMLDVLDGDSELELNGDELDGTAAEDDFLSLGGYGPGCPLADPPEEDDHPGQCSEDEISCGAGHWGGLYGPPDLRAPGCPISDTGIGDSGGLQEASGRLPNATYGIDQDRPLGPGHHQYKYTPL